MMAARYEIGARVPMEGLRVPVVGDPVDDGNGAWPRWFCLVTTPAQETKAQGFLADRGVPTSWYPTEEKWKRKPGLNRERIKYAAKIVPGYLFARFSGVPRCDLLVGTFPGRWYFSRIVTRDGVPGFLTDAQIADMRQAPEILRALRDEEERRRILNPGDRAVVDEGTFAGWTVDVARIDGALAGILIPLLGKTEIEIETCKLRKVIP